MMPCTEEMRNALGNVKAMEKLLNTPIDEVAMAFENKITDLST